MDSGKPGKGEGETRLERTSSQGNWRAYLSLILQSASADSFWRSCHGLVPAVTGEVQEAVRVS